jgi:hypothetical protein
MKVLREKLEVLRDIGLNELASAHGIPLADLDSELDDGGGAGPS